MNIRSALLLVHDPGRILSFAQALRRRSIEIVSSGATADFLSRAGLPVRVESRLPPDLLAIDEDDDGIGLLVVDMPASGVDDGLDVLVPALVRAAARAYDRIVVLVDPGDRTALLDALDRGGPDLEMRRGWAVKAARRVVEHDEEVADALAITETGELPAISSFVAELPDPLRLEAARLQTLPYGENPHQRAALYTLPTRADRPSLARAERLQGRPPGYNSLLDFDVALRLVLELSRPAAVLVQHGQPIGAAIAATDEDDLAGTYTRARLSDPENVYGAVVALNATVDGPTAERLVDSYLEGVMAPAYDADARAVLARRNSLRVMRLDPWPSPGTTLDMRRIAGGLLVQEHDDRVDAARHGRVVSQRQPDAAQWAALDLAWRVVRRVPSLGVVLARPGRVIGIGAGQPGRLDACRLAVDRARRAGHDLEGAVAASDGFFSFADPVAGLRNAGIAAIIQPGGSVRDGAVIGRADRLGLAMVFTGVRHFRH